MAGYMSGGSDLSGVPHLAETLIDAAIRLKYPESKAT
jgi:hypothetical protein